MYKNAKRYQGGEVAVGVAHRKQRGNVGRCIESVLALKAKSGTMGGKFYKKYGELGLELKSTRPKTNLNETPIRLKEKIIELRREKKECTLKLMWHLQDEVIQIHFQMIYQFL